LLRCRRSIQRLGCWVRLCLAMASHLCETMMDNFDVNHFQIVSFVPLSMLN
jgi:hypothetical protein